MAATNATSRPVVAPPVAAVSAAASKERDVLKMLDDERARTDQMREAMRRDYDNLKTAYAQVCSCWSLRPCNHAMLT